MKKSTFFSVSAIFIVFFIVNTLGNRIIPYKKEVNFKRPEDAINNFIEYINVYDEVNKDGRIVVSKSTKEFKESISKRFRINVDIYGYNTIFNQIPIYKEYELNEISLEENYILNDNYMHSLDGAPNYIKPKDIRAFILKGEGVYGDFSRNDIKVNKDKIFESKEKQVANFLFVVVDEGEGYVVDYYMSNWEE